MRLLWRMGHGGNDGGRSQQPSELLTWAMSGWAMGVDGASAAVGNRTPTSFRPTMTFHGMEGSPAPMMSPLGMQAAGLGEVDQDRVSACQPSSPWGAHLNCCCGV
jgi:hypothetical protein